MSREGGLEANSVSLHSTEASQAEEDSSQKGSGALLLPRRLQEKGMVRRVHVIALTQKGHLGRLEQWRAAQVGV